jgi:hypothetical protein
MGEQEAVHHSPVNWRVRISVCERNYQRTSLVLPSGTGHHRVNIMPLMIKCDNDAAIAAAQRPHGQLRMKHTPFKMNVIREHIRTGKIKMKYVASEDQLADIFTKPLRSPAFQEVRKKNWTKSRIR